MKRLVIILTILSISIVAFANADFDKTINHQYNNARAYIGETLYLLPITNSYYDIPHYPHFKNFEVDEDDITYNSTANNYKFNPFDYRDYKLAGTHKRHIEGHKFYVDDVVKLPNYEYKWVLYLTDLNTGDKVKFDYNGSPDVFMFSFTDFPFITIKYFNYCKSLIGTNLVFATHKSIIINELIETYNPDFKDINTGEVVQFSNTYAKWKIKDVVIDEYNLYLAFIVTNGKNTIKIPYNVQYSIKTKQPQYITLKYPAGVRVFSEVQWNEMINKYGETHMSLIMDSKISNDMTIEEKYLAGGRVMAKKKINSNTSNLKENSTSIINASEKTFNNTKNNIINIFKSIF